MLYNTCNKKRMEHRDLIEQGYISLKEASKWASVSKMSVYRLVRYKIIVHKDERVRNLVKTVDDDNPQGKKIYIYKLLAEKHFKNWNADTGVDEKIQEIEADIIKMKQADTEVIQDVISQDTIPDTEKKKVKVKIPKATNRLIDILERELFSKDEIIKELTSTIKGINQTLQQTNFLLAEGKKNENKTTTTKSEEQNGEGDKIRTSGEGEVGEDNIDSKDIDDREND